LDLLRSDCGIDIDLFALELELFGKAEARLSGRKSGFHIVTTEGHVVLAAALTLNFGFALKEDQDTSGVGKYDCCAGVSTVTVSSSS
jgi:hypothetical protein